MKKQMNKTIGYISLLAGSGAIQAASASHSGGGFHYDEISAIIAGIIGATYFLFRLKKK